MKNTILTLLAGALLAACSPSVGVVNMRRVFAESETGKAASAEIQRATASAKKAAEDAAAEAQKVGPLKAEAVAERQQKAAQLADEYRAAVQREDQRVSAGVLEKVREAVARVATDRHADLVLSVVEDPLAARPGIDLTKEVVARLDKATSAAPVAQADDPAKLRAENERLRAELAKRAKQ